MAAGRNLNRAFLALGVLLVVLSLVAIPFGGSDSSGSQSATGGGSQKANEVAIENFDYLPKEITVAAGTKITWTNGDSAKHTATSTDGADVFTTGTLDDGQKKSVTIEKAGTYEYFCQFHAFMKGTVVVE